MKRALDAKDDGENGREQPLGRRHCITGSDGQPLGQFEPAGLDQQDRQDERSTDLRLSQLHRLRCGDGGRVERGLKRHPLNTPAQAERLDVGGSHLTRFWRLALAQCLVHAFSQHCVLRQGVFFDHGGQDDLKERLLDRRLRGDRRSPRDGTVE